LTEVVAGVALFTLLALALVSAISLARRWLVPRGRVDVTVNGGRTLDVPVGGKLVETLASEAVYLPSACGGAGTCGMCRVIVHAGGGPLLPIERQRIDREDRVRGVRLACQVPVKEPLDITVPPGVLDAKHWRCRVREVEHAATFVRELMLDLPDGEEIDFRPGEYVQIHAPPYRAAYRDYDLDPRFRPVWERFGMLEQVSVVDEEQVRAYSLANGPDETTLLRLIVRIMPAPRGAPEGTPPGAVTSWVFALGPEDEVGVSGPFGDFLIRETGREMVYFGRGCGIAPLRAHIEELFRARDTTRRVSLWYGAYGEADILYRDDFERLAREHENFSYAIALESPPPGWDGFTGEIQDVFLEQFLRDHPEPEEVEYYLCAPPAVVGDLLATLCEFGVPRENVFYDDFGAAEDAS